MRFNLSMKEYAALSVALCEAMDLALAKPSQEEPQLVANMVCHLPRIINNLSWPNNGRYSVKSSGVFVHSQPYVKCNNFPNKTDPKSVEIGDLLLLRTYIERGEVKSRHALLLQAKKTNKLPTPIDNKNQHHLYATWPRFEYVRSTKDLNGKDRKITGADLYNGAKYLLLGNHQNFSHNQYAFLCRCFPRCTCYVFTAQPYWPQLSHYTFFIEELCEFILGNRGKPYKSPPHEKDKNWNRVIHDLITITSKRCSSYMNDASQGKANTRGQYLCFLAGEDLGGNAALLEISSKMEMFEEENPPSVPESWNDNESEEGGISIIEFLIENKGE